MGKEEKASLQVTRCLSGELGCEPRSNECPDRKSTVVNLSQMALEEVACSALSKGLNCAGSSAYPSQEYPVYCGKDNKDLT